MERGMEIGFPFSSLCILKFDLQMDCTATRSHWLCLKSFSEILKDMTWRRLKATIADIFLRRQLSCNQQNELKEAIGKLCLKNEGINLYNQMKQECEKQIYGVVESLVAVNSLEPVDFLRLLMTCWEDYAAHMGAICELASDLDEIYIGQTPNLPSLRDMGLIALQRHVSAHAEIQEKTVQGLLVMIRKYRLGEEVERLNNLWTRLTHMGMFSGEGMYEKAFEEPFLHATYKFYAHESLAYKNLGTLAYLEHVGKKLQDERETCDAACLPEKTAKKALNLANEQLLCDNICRELIQHIIADQNIGLLRKLYELEPIDLNNHVDFCIKDTGNSILHDFPKSMVMSALCDLKTFLDEILHDMFFSTCVSFVESIRSAFGQFLDKGKKHFMDLFAERLDEQLRGWPESNELNDFVHNGIQLLESVEWPRLRKAGFICQYQDGLGKRHAQGKGAPIEREDLVFSKLKFAVGDWHVEGFEEIEKMLKHIRLSNVFNRRFNKSDQSTEQLLPEIDTKVTLVTHRRIWPPYSPRELCILEPPRVHFPEELNLYKDRFEEFLRRDRAPKETRFMWDPYMWHCDVKVNFKRGEKSIGLSLLQTAIVMLFNDSDKLSFRDIRLSSGMEDDVCRRTMHTLMQGSYEGLLLKCSRDEDFGDDDLFEVNENFVSDSYYTELHVIHLHEHEEA